ncbi:MAG: DUF4373 domain-containing protein [Bacteroidales bacterium]|nr:DUF4373 domain-containing protein [Bacteroidales bacterium]
MKNKDAYWFKHDSNAKDDPKVMLLIDELGLEGYGIFWVLVELLRDQADYRYPLALIPSIARRYNTSDKKMLTVISNYGLFIIEKEQFFYSNSLKERMAVLDARREQAREAGIASGKSRKALPKGDRMTVQQTFKGRSTGAKPIDKSRIDQNKKENNPNYFKKLN